jgi:hypothetical protein
MEMKTTTQNPLVHPARVASRWLWVSSALDVIPIIGMGMAMFMAWKQNFITHPGVFPVILLGVSVAAALIAAVAWWKAKAGRLLREATAEGDGEAFARAFVLLRRYFAVVFLVSAVGTVFAVFGGGSA